jgi:hypothetical protein
MLPPATHPCLSDPSCGPALAVIAHNSMGNQGHQTRNSQSVRGAIACAHGDHPRRSARRERPCRRQPLLPCCQKPSAKLLMVPRGQSGGRDAAHHGPVRGRGLLVKHALVAPCRAGLREQSRRRFAARRGAAREVSQPLRCATVRGCEVVRDWRRAERTQRPPCSGFVEPFSAAPQRRGRSRGADDPLRGRTPTVVVKGTPARVLKGTLHDPPQS